MNGKTLRRARMMKDANLLNPVWARLSVATALLAAAGSVVGLLGQGHIYGRETPALHNAAIAQDASATLVVLWRLLHAMRPAAAARRGPS
jgi:hypothetical protein